MVTENFPDPLIRKERASGFFTSIQREIKAAVGNRPIAVYYPGIGGGEEPIDPTGPFTDIDADEVFGVDIFDGSTEDEGKVAPIGPKLSRVISQVRGIADNAEAVHVTDKKTALTVTFGLKGRKRTLTISKLVTDATKFVPDQQYPVIYSARSYRLVTHLPPEVLRSARSIIDIEQQQVETRFVKDFFVQDSTFKEVDLRGLPGARALLATNRSPSLMSLFIKRE